jgi:general secretion pathway protein A
MGKTTLIYSLLQRDYKRVRIAHIDDPKLSFLEMMRSILAQLNLYSPGSTKLDYLNTLDHLLDLHGSQERIAIVIDEAQLLSDDVLEELRLLSNRGQTRDRRLRLILVGQPELAERLKQPQLRQLNQRISSRGVLKPLSYDEMVKYVECRLSVQGGSCAAIFDRGALQHLYRRSDGIPRKINMLCHNAMIAAFHGGERKVSAKTAKRVAAEYHDAVSIHKPKTRVRPLTIVALAGAALAALLLVAVAYPNGGLNWVLNRAPERKAAPTKLIKHSRNAARHEARVSADDDGKPKSVASLAPTAADSGNAPAANAVIVSKSEVRPPSAPSERVVVPATSLGTGNGAGAENPATASPTIRQETQVTVKPGDTLEKIAIRYFGSTSAVNQLIQANPQLNNIDDLTIGQVIYLPRGANAAGARVDNIAGQPDSPAESSPER